MHMEDSICEILESCLALNLSNVDISDDGMQKLITGVRPSTCPSLCRQLSPWRYARIESGCGLYLYGGHKIMHSQRADYGTQWVAANKIGPEQ